MADKSNTHTMAVFCDFENIALGAEDANYAAFDIRRVLERLLLRGNVVVKKAYCDWARYDRFKAAMHEASFEMIEIPHTRQAGKNSADIRLVVDALDLCYTKGHVDTFVIVSGDSDFSPLVSKLRENNKLVIGVGVKSSTSDLLMSNCDEFIFYDDLVRDSEKPARRKRKAAAKASTKKSTAKKASAQDKRQEEALELVIATAEELFAERGEEDKLWGSMIKQAIKRRNPGFNESYHGFKSFGELLVAAKTRGLLDLKLDEKSGGYIITGVHSEG